MTPPVGEPTIAGNHAANVMSPSHKASLVVVVR